MKKVRLCLIIACCASLLLSSCSNMLDSLEKAAETKESTKTEKSEKAEETGNPENTQPLPQEPITPQPQIPEENQEPEEQQPEQQQLQEQQPEQQPKEISYTVEHYQQNINDDEYTKVAADTQMLTGKTGEQTKATAKTYTGFTAKAFEQKTLADGEASIIKIYYDRNLITYTFNANGGKWTGDKSELSYEGKYGSDFDAAPDDPDKLSPFFDPEKSDANNDYKLTGWDKEIPRTFGAENITFTAQWEIEKTLCKIEHFKQNLDGSGYTKVDADTQEIKLPPMYCSSDVPYDYIKTYEGFEYKSLNLNAEHNIEYYYDRESMTIIFDARGGSWSNEQTQKSVSGKYQETITFPEPPAREGYVFEGWNRSLNNTYDVQYESDATYTIPSSQNQTFSKLYAVWRYQSLKTLAVEVISNGDIWIDVSGNCFTARLEFPKSNNATYEWYFNNEKQDSETRSCTIDTSSLQPGYYELFVKATNEEGIYYITSCQVTVQ